MIITVNDGGHHPTYDETLREWVGQKKSLILSSAKIFHDAVFLGRVLRRPYFWKALGATISNGPIFFSYWDEINPFWLSASWRNPLCPLNLGAIWMNTWGFRTQGQLNVNNWGRYSFLNDSSIVLGILDEGVFEALISLPKYKSPKAKVFWMPDFTNVKLSNDKDNLVCDLIEFAEGRRILLCLGVLNEFKNLGFLEKVARALSPKEWVIAVMGEPEDRTNIAALESLPGNNVFMFKGRIPFEAVMNTIITKSHLVWGAYKSWEGSSNIQIKAGLLGVPILTLSGYLMGARAQRYSLGPSGNYETILGWAKDNFEMLKDWRSDTRGLKQFTNDFGIESARLRFLEIYQAADNNTIDKKKFSRLHFYGAQGLLQLAKVYGRHKGLRLA